MPGGSSGSDSLGAYLQMITAPFDVPLPLFGQAHSGAVPEQPLHFTFLAE